MLSSLGKSEKGDVADRPDELEEAGEVPNKEGGFVGVKNGAEAEDDARECLLAEKGDDVKFGCVGLLGTRGMGESG